MQYYGQEDDFAETERREDKILAAKMAFGENACRHKGYTYPVKSELEQEFMEQGERKHRYGLWRMAAAVMLFFAFLFGMHFDVSYRGWNRERLEQMLSDDTKWKEVVREVSNVMEHIPGAKKSDEKIGTE